MFYSLDTYISTMLLTNWFSAHETTYPDILSAVFLPIITSFVSCFKLIFSFFWLQNLLKISS